MDSGWEGTVAQALEHMDEVKAYAKNIARLQFLIRYTFEGQERLYLPDFIAKIDDGHDKDDLLNLIIEVSGEQRGDKDAKVATVESLWVPAVNNCGRIGRWAFVQVREPHLVMREVYASYILFYGVYIMQKKKRFNTCLWIWQLGVFQNPWPNFGQPI